MELISDMELANVSTRKGAAEVQLAQDKKDTEGWMSKEMVEELYLNWKSPVEIEQIRTEAYQQGIREVVEWIQSHEKGSGAYRITDDDLDRRFGCQFERIRSYPSCFEDCPDTEVCPYLKEKLGKEEK